MNQEHLYLDPEETFLKRKLAVMFSRLPIKTQKRLEKLSETERSFLIPDFFKLTCPEGLINDYKAEIPIIIRKLKEKGLQDEEIQIEIMRVSKKYQVE